MPPPSPTGIEACDEATLARYRADGFAYPPYQYMLANLVCRAGNAPRTLNSQEREWLLGFPIDHTAKCWSRARSARDRHGWETKRCGLLGNSFSCTIVAYVMQEWAHARGLRELQPSILEILQRTGPLLCPGSFSVKKKDP